MQPTAADPLGHPEADSPTLDEVAAAFPDLEILELIGRGGMGAVFKARQKSLDRSVALKILPRSLAADPRFAAYFEGEAKALAALSHPNIVTIHDFGSAGGFYFLLMEYVDGVNLRELLRSHRLTAEEALAIVPTLCEALQFAHDRGIVHRDIKPENLLLDRGGRIKIADFGIAKIVGKGEGVGDRTAGTPAYMSPEQRETPELVDSRADIYSLGVVFYEMLTGERPQGAIEPPSGKVAIDVRLDEVVLRALKDEPELRWQTAAELGTQVQTIVSDRRPEAGGPKSESDDWRVTCLTCGNSKSYSELGGIRVGAHSLGKRLLVHCSGCGAMRKAIVHRANSRPIPPQAARARTTSLIGFWSLSAIVLSGILVIATIFIGRSSAHFLGLSGLLAVLASPVVVFVAGLVLGGIWLRRLRGSSASRAAWAFALTLLSAVLPLALAVAAIFATFSMQEKAARSLAEQEQKRVREMAEMQEQLAGAQLAVAEAQDRNEGAEQIAKLEAREAELEARMKTEGTIQGRGSVPEMGGVAASWILLMAPFLFAFPLGGVGTVLGWRHLAWLRREPGAGGGMFHAVTAALFWPVILAAGLVFTLILIPLNHGRSANLGLSLGIFAAIAVSVWIVRSTIAWVKNDPGSGGVPARVIGGATLIGVGLLVSLNWLVDLSDEQRRNSDRRQRQIVQLSQLRSAAASRKFRAEAEIDGIEVNEVNAQTEAQRQRFAQEKKAPLRAVEQALAELNRIDFEQMELVAAQRLDDHWWGRAMVPILIGLALVIPGVVLVSKGKGGRDALG